jgi:hypothetical protein
MKEKELFIKAISTLFHTWGGDTPAEAVWAGNDLLVWYEKEYNVTLGIEFVEPYGDIDYGIRYNEVIEAIRNS